MSTPRNNRWSPAPDPQRSREAVPAGPAHRHASASGPISAVQARTVGITGTAGDESNVAEAITVALRCAAQPGVPDDLRGIYSTLAHRLAQSSYATFHPLALAAARLRAQVLDEHHEHAEAARLWGHLISLFQLAHKPELEQQARIAHALDLHRTGGCGEALNQISYAWLDASQPGRQQPGPGTVLHLYAAMLTACGRDDDLHALLAEAAEHTDLAEPGAPDHAGEQTGHGQPTTDHDAAPDGMPEVQPAHQHRRVCAYHALAAREGRS